MQLATLIVILGILFTVAVIAALGVMQSRRFRFLSKMSQVVTWLYLAISIVLAIAILISYFTIEF